MILKTEDVVAEINSPIYGELGMWENEIGLE